MELALDRGINNVKELELEKEQKHFMDTVLGKAINSTLNYGLKKVLPDFIENQIIDIKDELLKGGFNKGIKKAIEKGNEIRKSTSGILTEKFDTVKQMELAAKKGGLIETISKVLEKSLNKIEKENVINKDAKGILKKSTTLIKTNLEKNINNLLKEQKALVKSVENGYERWKLAYQEKDISKMEKEYEKIKENVDKIIPMEDINRKIIEIENINNLIKNKEKANTEIIVSKVEYELAQKL